jgi:hypothetical protein
MACASLPGFVLQQTLWCPCGAAEPHAKGRCRRCYDSHRRSLSRFGGRREQALARDGWRCVSCAGDPPIVHHRRPGRTLSILITLCSKCHGRVHHAPRLVFGMSEILERLWREQHPRQAEQLLLPEFTLHEPEVVIWQPSLFAA